MQVVEDDDERRRLLRGGDEQGPQRVEEGEAVLLGGSRGRRGRVRELGQRAAQFRDEVRERFGSGAQRGAQFLGRELGGVRPDDLHPRPERGRTAVLPAAAPVDARTERLGALVEGLAQGRLADAGVSGDEVEVAAPLVGVVQRRFQLLQLAVTADDVGAGGVRGRHHGRWLAVLEPVRGAARPDVGGAHGT